MPKISNSKTNFSIYIKSMKMTYVLNLKTTEIHIKKDIKHPIIKYYFKGYSSLSHILLYTSLFAGES